MRNTYQHSQKTRRWPNAGPPSATLAQHQTSTGSTPRVGWAACNPVNTKHLYNICTMLDQRRRRCTNVLCLLGTAAGLVLLTASDDYKPTPTQCLSNVGAASPVLASIHSVLVSTSCCRYLHADGTDMMLWTKAGSMLAGHLWRWPTFSVATNTTQ